MQNWGPYDNPFWNFFVSLLYKFVILRTIDINIKHKINYCWKDKPVLGSLLVSYVIDTAWHVGKKQTSCCQTCWQKSDKPRWHLLQFDLYFQPIIYALHTHRLVRQPQWLMKQQEKISRHQRLLRRGLHWFHRLMRLLRKVSYICDKTRCFKTKVRNIINARFLYAIITKQITLLNSNLQFVLLSNTEC